MPLERQVFRLQLRRYIGLEVMRMLPEFCYTSSRSHIAQMIVPRQPLEFYWISRSYVKGHMSFLVFSVLCT